MIMYDHVDPLRLRLKNCLETLLEFEPDIRNMDKGGDFLREFFIIRDFLNKVNDLDLNDEDVGEVEEAASRFMEELREPSMHSFFKDNPNYVLQ